MNALTLFDLSRLLDRRHDHRLMASLLLTLHAAVLAGVGSALGRSLITAHLGVFFLWQPIWQREQRLDVPALVVILLFAATFIGLFQPWLLFAWLIVLIGIVAGRMRASRRERYASMLVLMFLIAELLINVVPLLFALGPVEPVVREVFRVGLFAVPLGLLLLPAATGFPRETYPIEFFRGIIVALITALLAVGSALIALQRSLDYASALFASLFAVAAFLLFTSWLITPAAGTGLGALWEKSVLNIGTPFEAWMTSLADLSATEHSPHEFLVAAMGALSATPWVQGARWREPTGEGACGERTARSTEIVTDELAVTLYLEHPPGPALLLHCRLLVETLSHFYAAKRRAQEQAHEAHVRAIHETGARLTHDIKNLLQSLKLLMPAATGEATRDAARLELLQRQLPVIAQRLQAALDKLRDPSGGDGERLGFSAWWDRFAARHVGHGLVLDAIVSPGAGAVRADVLDSVIENLLDNAQRKRSAGKSPRIEVRALADVDAFHVSVTDNGSAVPADIAPVLFRQAVVSDDGLGIGLYQAGALATAAGGRVRLTTNRDGEVRFEVSGRYLQT